MGKKSKEQQRAEWAAREAEYQRMLAMQRGPREAAQPAGGSTKSAKTKPVRERRPSSQLPDVQPGKVVCPRCAAKAGDPCRNGRGQRVAPHADRRRAAAQKGKRTSRRAIEQRQLQAYLDGDGEPSTGGASNPMTEVFAAARQSRTTRGRSAETQRRMDGW